MRSYKVKTNLHHWSARHEQKERELSLDCNYRLPVDLGAFCLLLHSFQMKQPCSWVHMVIEFAQRIKNNVLYVSITLFTRWVLGLRVLHHQKASTYPFISGPRSSFTKSLVSIALIFRGAISEYLTTVAITLQLNLFLCLTNSCQRCKGSLQNSRLLC